MHRKLEQADLYYIDNRNDRVEQVDATFRIDRKAPELWHADSGMIEPAAYHIESAIRPCHCIWIRMRRYSSSSASRPVRLLAISLPGARVW